MVGRIRVQVIMFVSNREMAVTGLKRSQQGNVRDTNVLPDTHTNLHCIKIRRSHRGAVASQGRAASQPSANSGARLPTLQIQQIGDSPSCCRGARVAGASPVRA
jgi:hypothetical protein